MMATLMPLHAMMERGPQTLREQAFSRAFGAELREAKKWCSAFKQSGRSGDMNRAWDLYR
jgi:FKBP12-rapamycin complex-associated protein